MASVAVSTAVRNPNVVVVEARSLSMVFGMPMTGRPRSLSRRAFLNALQKLVPELQDRDLARGGSGVRAQVVTREGFLADDFIIVESRNAINVLNAPSPAATASIAIGNHIADLAAKHFD